MSGPEAPAGGLGESMPPVAALSRVVRSRYRDRDYGLRRGLLVADLFGLWLGLGLAMVIWGQRANPLGESLWIAPTLPFWAFLFWSYRLYERPIRQVEPSHLDDTPALFHAVLVGTLLLWLFFRFVAPVGQLNLGEVLLFGVFSLPLIATLRSVLRARNLRRHGPERVFAVAPPEDVWLLRRKFTNHPEYEMALAGAVSCPETEELGLHLNAGLEEVEGLIEAGQVDHLIVRLDATFLPQERTQELMQACHRAGIRFSCFPSARGLVPPGVEVNHLEGMGLLTCQPPVLSRTARYMKRLLDVLVSGTMLVVLSPLLAAIAIAIRLGSKGPAFYRQTRVGREGRRFELLKFRTMVENADRLDDELMALSADPDWLVVEGDPRVTRVGRLLRRTSLDELPQLWNVLRGKMSMVGPRPLSLRDDRKVLGWRRNRLDLTPGITGYWQILGRNSIPFQEMLEVDYAYVSSWSLWHDVEILLRTIPALLRRPGVN